MLNSAGKNFKISWESVDITLFLSGDEPEPVEVFGLMFKREDTMNSPSNKAEEIDALACKPKSSGSLFSGNFKKYYNIMKKLISIEKIITFSMNSNAKSKFIPSGM